LARGLEAAHSHARVLHAGGDATGSAIESTLARAVRASGIEIVEQAFLAELIVDEGRAIGVELIDPEGVTSRRYAHAVVLATGGAGTLFAHTTNPSIATGDGVAAAWRAGVRLTDVEFYQFHPTALAAAGGLLVSEAVRGEGAVLLDARGERFMLDAHPDAELAPRDVVARAIATRMAAQGGKPVLLDATALGAAHLAERFPTIDSGTRAAGLDWGAMPIPVTPAAHYWMGGIATDVWGRSSLPGLFAVGEVACTGVHGANRLASNSLLEGLVFADRAIRALTEDSAALSVPTLSVPTLSSAALSEPTLSQADSGSIAAGPAGPADPSWDRAALQSLMWDSAGVQRCGDELRATAATLASWSVPERSPGSPASASLALREDENLLQLARLVVTAALAREESRGAHFRTDFPGTAAESQHLVLQREESLAC
jgi:L-aspartate oxidase